MKYYSNNLSSNVKVGDTVVHFGKQLEVMQIVGNPVEEVCAFDVLTDKEYVFTHIRQYNQGLITTEDLTSLFLPMSVLRTYPEIISIRYPHTSIGHNATPLDDKACHDYDGEITPPDLEMWRWHR